MTSITIRAATKHDGETLLSLIDALAAYEKQPTLEPEARARLLRDGFEEPRRFVALLAEVDGMAVGYALFFETYSSYLAQPTLYLEDILVLSSFRGRGIGTALFKACVTEAIHRGCGRMEWSVLDWNKTAIDFYRRVGAQRLDDRRLYRLTASEMKAFVEKTSPP